jgi:hypothetical protein
MAVSKLGRTVALNNGLCGKRSHHPGLVQFARRTKTDRDQRRTDTVPLHETFEFVEPLLCQRYAANSSELLANAKSAYPVARTTDATDLVSIQLVAIDELLEMPKLQTAVCDEA